MFDIVTLNKLLFICSFFFFCFLSSAAQDFNPEQINGVFIENKGQVCNQNFEPREDVLFSGTDGQLNFHLKSNGISYQLNKIDSWQLQDNSPSKINVFQQKIAKQITNYRIDVSWLNANAANIKKGLASASYDNFYLQHCPNGVLNVKSYQDITYQNIYEGINLKWYTKDGHLKYDYEVAAGANYEQIQLQINGAKKISVNSKGELVIKTPLGEIVEQAPVVFQANKILIAKWYITKSVVSIKIENLNPKQSFVIDPIVRTWATYYGGNAYTYVNSSATDSIGNVYITGHTNSSLANSIATTGSYQNTINVNLDAFLVQFNSSGQRQWGTYYGGDDIDEGAFCKVDKYNDIYMGGPTNSSTGSGIASAGCYQSVYGGATDVFLAKFNSFGFRVWSTYYGGNNIEGGTSCSFDVNGDVYFCGYTKTNTTNIIATSSSHQSSHNGDFDAFLVKFNSNGNRLWSTYYGGVGGDYATSCAIDSNNDVYLTGYTDSNSGTDIATSVSHQPFFGNPSVLGFDGFVAKFNSNGIRQWGTYYGGESNDVFQSCDFDSNNNLYLLGITSSIVGIATFGSHQVTFAGSPNPNYGDAFLVKMNSNGVRQWGTYYGGFEGDGGLSCAVDIFDNIYIAGSTASNFGTAIATVGSHQAVYGGGVYDGFLTKFDNNGTRLWGTYYGGNLEDDGRSCSVYKNVVYLAGGTLSSNANISTIISHQPVFTGIASGYLAQFNDCNSSIPPINNTPSTNALICANQSTTLSVSGFGNINWYSSSTGGSSLASGLSYTTPPLGIGTYTFFAEDDFCNIIPIRTPITVTVMPSPIANITGIDSICNGQSTLLSVSGGTNVVWNNGLTSNTINVAPSTTTNYSVVVSNTNCSDTAYSTITVLANPTAFVSGNDSICLGQSTILAASGGSAYVWSTGVNADSISVNPTATSNYSVVVSNAFCKDTALITVNVFNTPVATISGNDTLCLGQNTNLIAGGIGTYTWNTGSASNNILVAPNINTTYTLIVNNGICSDTAQKTVVVNPLPTASIIGTNTLCVGLTTTLTANGGTTYNWGNGNVNASVSISPTMTTNYSVMVTNTFGCSGLAFTTVSVTSIPMVSISGDTVICANETTVLTANGIGDFLWNTSETNLSISINPLVNTVYYVTASNNCGNAKDSIHIKVNPLPMVSVSNDTTILIDNSVNLFASGGNNYTWLPANLSCNTCSVVNVFPNSSTVYTVTIFSIDVCSVTKEIRVNIESEFEIFVPDIFSPNGDGQNDVLYVRGLGINDMSFKIYDRWGEKVFESNNLLSGWDGSFKGVQLNNAVFVYDLKVNLSNGKTVNKHGDITLIK